MHHCDEFRERITEHIIDRKDLSGNSEFQPHFLICSSCSDFYAESKEMIEAISSVTFEFSEEHWDGMTDRLRLRLQQEKWGRRPITPFLKDKKWGNRATTPFFRWAEVLAAAALVLVTVGLYRVAIPEEAAPGTEQFVYIDQTLPLDPVTIDFLEESELLLRNVMKIDPKDSEDLGYAKQAATAQLVGIAQRKAAAAEILPVVNVMDTYETILRDIRNLDEQAAEDDISDIQNRIQSNALIANMKAFQPTISMVDLSLR